MASTGEALRRARNARGLTQSELARRARISRQALSAIESGAYQPSVAVALNLGRELGETVERLFGASNDEAQHIDVPWPARDSPAGEFARTHVALGRVGGKVVAVAQAGARITLAPAAGTLDRAARRHAQVSTLRSNDEIDSTLLVAGCDPAVAIMSDWLARRRSPISVAALAGSSKTALATLLEGRAHTAGVHLRDPRSGEYNTAPVRRALGGQRAVLVHFAQWELGLATALGNPLALRGFADLARHGLRIVNRERGSGARAALDEALGELGLAATALAGYERELGGHLEIAAAIAEGHADAGVTIRVAAQAYGLGFIPVREELYDLVILECEMESAPVKALLDALTSRRFAAEISQLCAYDTRHMGEVAARINS